MGKAINDATLNKAGDIYQYLIALKDCFELNDGGILQIETNGDVSIINNTQGLFQREVKHHFSNQNLSDRDVDFWKTLANWYDDYARINCFSSLILSTTANISPTSSFTDWNNLKKKEKLQIITNIGAASKDKEETFRKQYDRIFNNNYDMIQLLEILEKFTIESSQTTLIGISNEFSKYVGHIPDENRDSYIGALLGRILFKVKDPPHKWEVTKEIFDQILQTESAAHGCKAAIPLPNEYAKVAVPKANTSTLEQKKFVESIREIHYDKMISYAISDYWKADMTITKYFRDDLMYLESLDTYIDALSKKLFYAKSDKELDIENGTKDEQIKISKQFYNQVMQWNANDFGSIIRNQDFFQRGVIHNIVDETHFKWKVGEDEDEH